MARPFPTDNPLRQGGFEPGAMTVAEANAFVQAEYKRWGEVIRAAGIKPQ